MLSRREILGGKNIDEEGGVLGSYKTSCDKQDAERRHNKEKRAMLDRLDGSNQWEREH